MGHQLHLATTDSSLYPFLPPRTRRPKATSRHHRQPIPWVLGGYLTRALTANHELTDPETPTQSNGRKAFCERLLVGILVVPPNPPGVIFRTALRTANSRGRGTAAGENTLLTHVHPRVQRDTRPRFRRRRFLLPRRLDDPVTHSALSDIRVYYRSDLTWLWAPGRYGS